jgi:hypothetical protein
VRFFLNLVAHIYSRSEFMWGYSRTFSLIFISCRKMLVHLSWWFAAWGGFVFGVVANICSRSEHVWGFSLNLVAHIYSRI